MNKTGPADSVMPACGCAPPRRPVLTRAGSCELVGVLPLSTRPAARVPGVVGAVFPGDEFFKPVPGRPAARPGRLRPAGSFPRPRRAGALCPPCSGPPAHPLYLYLLKRPAVALSGCPFAPGRDMLCILTSPPRWLQWP